MDRVLIIDDEKEMREMIGEYLEIKGIEVLSTGTYGEAEKHIYDVDLILLDVMMPNLDGFQVCEKIRNKVQCPIIFVSARNFQEDIIKGLGIGGDDYIEKPFKIAELYARIMSHLRREKRIINKEKKQLISGNVTLDIEAKRVTCLGKEITFPKKEYELIELLMINKGRVFTKEQLFDKVWGYNSESNLGTIVEHIKNIRYKMKNVDHEKSYIKTVWGIGYKWDVKNV